MKNKTHKSVLYHPTAYHEPGHAIGLQGGSMKSCCTCAELAEMLTAAIMELSPKAKAELRVELRKTYDMPAQPEPDLWMN